MDVPVGSIPWCELPYRFGVLGYPAPLRTGMAGRCADTDEELAGSQV
jgi:hypothetical protein